MGEARRSDMAAAVGSEGATGALRPGDPLEVFIEKGVYRGLGLGRHEGQVVFVPRALPSDRIRARVESVARGYLHARLEDVVEPGPGRRPSPCPYVPRCGGCAYQELAYADQLLLKEAILRESLERAGAPWRGEIPVAGCPEVGWRTRASFHLGFRGGSFQLGLREEGTHTVVDLERCLQLSEPMNGVARSLLAALASRPFLAPTLRDVELAESLDGSERVVALHANLAPRSVPALAALLDAAPGVTGFGALTGRGRLRRYVSLRGEPYVYATVLGIRFRSHVRSFFQANRFLVEDLALAVVDAMPPGGRVLDLYAGVGLFSLLLARRAEEVRCAEINPAATLDARANARAAGLGNVRIREGDVRETLASWRPEPGERILVDPPRNGAGLEVVRAIAARRPAAIVYVSCDPPTLGRDVRGFAEQGYRMDSVRAFDLFPDTFHIETIVRLVPA